MLQQKIIVDYPPMMKEIDKKFRVYGKPVIFSWGNIIYNPQNIEIPPQLIVHEAVHGERQLQTSVRSWWEQYIADAAFRLQEELPAHQAEYLWLAENAPSRQVRRVALKRTAQRLAAPLYGSMVTKAKAKKLIKDGAE